MSTNTKFLADRAKRVSNCKKCRVQIAKGELRLAKLVPNYFASDSANAPELKQYFHPKCLFEVFSHARASTKVIDSPEDVIGWSDLPEEDKETLLSMIKSLKEQRSKGNFVKGSSGSRKNQNRTNKCSPAANEATPGHTDSYVAKAGNNETEKYSSSHKASFTHRKIMLNANEKKDDLSVYTVNEKKRQEQKIEDDVVLGHEKGGKVSKFDLFKLFCKLCDVVGKVSKFTDKSSAVNMYVKKEGYDGNVYLLAKLLIPSSDHRVYNLKEKQLIKLFSHIYSWSAEELTDDFNQSGDVSVTIRKFFEKLDNGVKKSNLTIQGVDKWLDKLAQLNTEDSQESHLSWISNRVSPLELQYIIRLIKKDLRINAGAKHILEGICPGSYEAFQTSRDLKMVIESCVNGQLKSLVDARISLGTPIKPMLAEPCRSVEQAMQKCVNGMYGEIKYDGERLQLHKNGDNFAFFSRSMRPVSEHKVEHLRTVISEAFPMGNDMILDSEVLMVDTVTGKPLPFGTLGVHKKENFENATVCLFVFDCMFFNGESLIDRPLKERRSYLRTNIKEIPNRILLSNLQLIEPGEDKKLKEMIWKAIDEGLEGLVLKDVNSIYEPGKRHWLKVKKDYLEDGRMADTADLIVLGAYYGTGAKGGLMSVFLMGVYDERSQKFLTVTKCGNGHDDATLDRINKELKSKMQKISKVYEKLPNWLICSRSLVPDFVIEDPKLAPVWEISGAEFSRSDNHTAMGISIRFPRVTRIRDNKTWESATNMAELKRLYDISKQKCDLDLSVEDSIPLFLKETLNDPINAKASEQLETSNNTMKRPYNDADSEDLEPSKKKRMLTDSDSPATGEDESSSKVEKPFCKYGKRCFRQNVEHLEKYIHPPKD